MKVPSLSLRYSGGMGTVCLRLPLTMDPLYHRFAVTPATLQLHVQHRSEKTSGLTEDKL